MARVRAWPRPHLPPPLPPTPCAGRDLNMVSALVHVLADTARSVAVMVAGFIAVYTEANGTEVDAWAAVVVSIAIGVSAVPIMGELAEKVRELRADAGAGGGAGQYARLPSDLWLDDDDSDEDDEIVPWRGGSTL